MTSTTVIAVMAHPDDAEIWAGGTLARYARQGCAAILVGTTDEMRRREAIAGAEVLGAQLHLVKKVSVSSVINLIDELNADVLICHRWDDPHPDHRRIGMLVTGAVQKAAIGRSKRIRLYVSDTYQSLTLDGSVSGRSIVNIDETFELKIRALRHHKSQPIDHFAEMASRQAGFWGARIGATWGEAFDPVPVLGVLPEATML
ncbi:MAG TPA: PIG-L family deacetylase [Verrucomicrobiae bacterium]|nr:PIG-L family deacetylase [Verrucomicrobiae bacterium]